MKLLMMFTADLVYSYCTTVSGGPGLKVQCPDQMYAQGWCSSGKDKNCCTGRCSHELKCCSTYEVPRNHCYNIYGHYGEFIKCDADSAVVGACGSGENADCSARFLDEMYNKTGLMPDEEARGGSYTVAYCCEHGKTVSPNGYWFTQGCGFDVSCRPNQFMQGLCGSGKNGDCGNIPNVRQGTMPEPRCSNGGHHTAIYCADILD